MVYQIDDNDCGNACIRNILVDVYKDEAYEIMPIHNHCDDLLKIKKELEYNGLIYDGYKLDDIEQIKKEELPAIARIQNGDVFHFVVIYKINKKNVFIKDPQFGEYIISIKEFNEIYLGQLLLKSKIVIKPEPPKYKILSLKEVIPYLIFFIMQTASMLLSLFFVSAKTSYIIKICLFMLTALTILIQNIYNSFLRNKLEISLISNYLNFVCNKNDYLHLSNIINLIIKKYSEIVSYSVAIIVSMYLIFSNGILISLIGVSSIVIALIYYLIKPKLNLINRRSTILENEIINNFNSLDKMNKLFIKNRKNSTDYKILLLLPYILAALIMSIFILTEMYLTMNYNINYFLFYIFLGLGLVSLNIKLINTYTDDNKLTSEINSLSYSLPIFILKNKTIIGYTNSIKNDTGQGDTADGS